MDPRTPGYFPPVKPFRKAAVERVATMPPPSAAVPKPHKTCTVCGAMYKWSYCEACFNRFAAQEAKIRRKFSNCESGEF